MKLKTFFRIALLIAVVGLTACTTFQLRDANDQLTTYYYAKKQAEKNNDWQMLEGTIASLSKLAEDAAKQAEEEDDNVRNQIAFYRIAATAAWQAGDTNVLAYASEGQKLCTDDNFNRDCGMLLVIPYFASVDEIKDRFLTLQDKIKNTPADKRGTHAQAAEKIFTDYQAALISVLKHRPKIANSKTHPDFLKALDHNTGALLCELIGLNTVGLITTAKGDVNKAKCELYELKKRALNAGLDQFSVKCLPKSEDQLKKPKNCP